MEMEDAKYKWFLLALLILIFLSSVLLKAQNYKNRDITKTDTTKTDTSRTGKKELGFNSIKFNSIKHLRNEYAFTGNISSSEYFIDTLKTPTDTTKKDTLGYNVQSNKVNTSSNNYVNEYYSSSIDKSSKFKIHAVTDLTQGLKNDINLTDKQIPEVKNILREYEAKTYESNGNSEDVKEAAEDTQDNINDILSNTQQKEWQKVKNDWWASVEKELNLSNLKNNTRL